jgi:hypothetical protein
MDTQIMTIPDEGKFISDIQAINKFQATCRQYMKQGHDYGVIPGTQKPTLLKPGAEKIAKLLGLCDNYEIIDRQELWDKPFFRYLVKCKLITGSGVVVSEGLGECNSYESKYRWRWVFPSGLSDGMDKDNLVTRTINTRNGKVKQYRLENDDVFSQVNTILKMAKKRSLVDAALSAGRLSEVFTQDIEDMDIHGDTTPEPESDTKPKPKSDTKKGTQIPEKGTFDATEVKSLGDLFNACMGAYKMKPEDVLRELGLSSKEDIADAGDAWEKIKAVKEAPE